MVKGLVRWSVREANTLSDLFPSTIVYPLFSFVILCYLLDCYYKW